MSQNFRNILLSFTLLLTKFYNSDIIKENGDLFPYLIHKIHIRRMIRFSGDGMSRAVDVIRWYFCALDYCTRCPTCCRPSGETLHSHCVAAAAAQHCFNASSQPLPNVDLLQPVAAAASLCCLGAAPCSISWQPPLPDVVSLHGCSCLPMCSRCCPMFDFMAAAQRF